MQVKLGAMVDMTRYKYYQELKYLNNSEFDTTQKRYLFVQVYHIWLIKKTKNELHEFHF